MILESTPSLDRQYIPLSNFTVSKFNQTFRPTKCGPNNGPKSMVYVAQLQKVSTRKTAHVSYQKHNMCY